MFAYEFSDLPVGTRPAAAVTVLAATDTITMGSLMVANCKGSSAQIAPKPVRVISPVDAA